MCLLVCLLGFRFRLYICVLMVSFTLGTWRNLFTLPRGVFCNKKDPSPSVIMSTLFRRDYKKQTWYTYLYFWMDIVCQNRYLTKYSDKNKEKIIYRCVLYLNGVVHFRVVSTRSGWTDFITNLVILGHKVRVWSRFGPLPNFSGN